MISSKFVDVLFAIGKTMCSLVTLMNRGPANAQQIYRQCTVRMYVHLIKTLFITIRQKRMDSKHNKVFRKVFIAIQRLNRCMLTYTISNRISVVAAKLECCPYSPQDMRRAMKTIYGFRSDIVRGRDTKKNSMIAIDGKQVESKKLAVEFLRYSLLFIIGNQESLEVKEFEAAFDSALSNNDSK